MKVVIDLIEDIRDSISNNETYNVTAMLLKEDAKDTKNLIYAGETSVASFHVDEISKELIFTVDTKEKSLQIGDLVKHLLIMDMEKMMYEVKLSVSDEHAPQELVGFGFNAADAKYALFIMA
jgi:exosome complex RNA-binding protein Csl4